MGVRPGCDPRKGSVPCRRAAWVRGGRDVSYTEVNTCRLGSPGEVTTGVEVFSGHKDRVRLLSPCGCESCEVGPPENRRGFSGDGGDGERAGVLGAVDLPAAVEVVAAVGASFGCLRARARVWRGMGAGLAGLARPLAGLVSLPSAVVSTGSCGADSGVSIVESVRADWSVQASLKARNSPMPTSFCPAASSSILSKPPLAPAR
jgi:hypothetical protein